jgi:bidirectional [NiFe] hydrogenase diaphorase subunit
MKKAPPINFPSDDKRWRIVQGTMRRNGFARHSLIETLHTVQESFGFLDEDSMRYVSGSLRVPLSQVYGVSTFYHLFSLKPAGKHTCVMCTGTACYIKGAPQLLETIADEYGIHPEETTPDRELSLLTARCVGSCGLGPVAVVDGEVVGKLTSDVLLDRLQEVLSSDDT